MFKLDRFENGSHTDIWASQRFRFLDDTSTSRPRTRHSVFEQDNGALTPMSYHTFATAVVDEQQIRHTIFPR